MADVPPAPWTLACPWCDYSLLVFARGAHGRDQGSGYEAAMQMERHVDLSHGKTWAECRGEQERMRATG